MSDGDWWRFLLCHSQRRGTDPGYVYLMECGGIYKIGLSKDPSKRRKQIERGLSTSRRSPRVELLAQLPTGAMKATEEMLHSFYRDEHFFLEWFELRRDQVETFVAMCFQVGAWAHLARIYPGAPHG